MPSSHEIQGQKKGSINVVVTGIVVGDRMTKKIFFNENLAKFTKIELEDKRQTL